MISVIAQAVAETVRDPEVALTSAVAAVVALGKVWDKIVGHRVQREARTQRDAIAKTLSDHAATDVASFGRIDVSLAVIETGMSTITKQLDLIEKRQYNERGD